VNGLSDEVFRDVIIREGSLTLKETLPSNLLQTIFKKMNNFSLCHWRLISLGVLFFLTGCGLFSDKQNTTTHLKDGWSEVGLSGDSITRFKRNGQYLYAGTNNGLYRHDLSKSDKSWSNLGLSGRRIRDMVIFNDNKILAAVAIADFASGDPTLFLTTDGGKSWKNYQNGFGGG
jgi:hypothetical protein